MNEPTRDEINAAAVELYGVPATYDPEKVKRALMAAYSERDTAHAPTDEREALANMIPLDLVHDRGHEGFPKDAFEAADRILAAGFRRTVQDEPTLIECPHWSPGRITMRKRCTACEAEPQGEPSDAAVKAAMDEYLRAETGGKVRAMRAALRAAAEVEAGNQ